MQKRPPPAAQPRNRFLAHLPEVEYRRLLPLLKPVELEAGQVLYEARGPIEHAYFPTDAVLSALTVMQDGNAIEVATVGHKGLVGPDGFGGTPSPHKVIARADAQALRIASRALHEATVTDGPLKELLTAYHVA